MIRQYLLIWCLLLPAAALTTGCSTAPPWWGPAAGDEIAKQQTAAPVIEPPDAAQAALRQYRQVQTWSQAQYAQELAALEQAYSRQPLARQRLRLAVALGFGDCTRCDRKRAAALLRQTQASAAAEDAGTLAGLFLELLEVRTQLDERGQALARQRRDVTSLQQELQLLQQKLDALTSIEESLHRRE